MKDDCSNASSKRYDFRILQSMLFPQGLLIFADSSVSSLRPYKLVVMTSSAPVLQHHLSLTAVSLERFRL